MGFTTKGSSTKTRYYDIRKDVISNVDDIMDDTGWDFSDVLNRSVKYYVHKYKKGSLNDTAPTTRTTGFTTAGQDTSSKTVSVTEQVVDWIDKYHEEWQWYKKDVVNRALMYYINDIQSGSIDDKVYTSSANK